MASIPFVRAKSGMEARWRKDRGRLRPRREAAPRQHPGNGRFPGVAAGWGTGVSQPGPLCAFLISAGIAGRAGADLPARYRTHHVLPLLPVGRAGRLGMERPAHRSLVSPANRSCASGTFEEPDPDAVARRGDVAAN